ncbi:biopolymer transporter ExbB [Cognatiyoonia sediminum]|nr:biopolymer transporter ExbB [Cognatiyoonia sediminum]
MLIVLGLVSGVIYIGLDQMRQIFLSNPALNGLIVMVFVIGVLSTFAQVYGLMRSVQWIEGFAGERVGANLVQAPPLLAPLATLLRSRGARMQISSSSSRSILDSVGQRIDEVREITRYIGNTLIFLGLLGTFYGLATTVPALVETIRSLSPEEGQSGADVFSRLQSGLENQLGGMGTAFSSSLLGLAGSLVVGLLELFAGHGQNRFYQELEEWLSSITRLGYAGDDAGSDEGGSAVGAYVDHLAEQMEALQDTFAKAEASRIETDARIAALTSAVEAIATQGQAAGVDDSTSALLANVAEGQSDLIEKLNAGGIDGIDAESRMRLRSIDVQLLRILEELAAGRQQSTADLRSDLAELTKAIKGKGR